MRTSLKRGLTGAVALAATAAVIPIIAASPASAASNIVGSGGTISLSPTSGAAATTFGLSITGPAGAAAVCPGDNTTGYKWSTFIIPAAADPASITFTGAGALTAVGSEYRNNLYSGSSAVRSKLPDIASYTITGIPSMQFQFLDANTTIPDGSYKVGIACHGGSTGASPSNYWAKTITISHTGGVFAYVEGAPAAAPTIVSATPNVGTSSIDLSVNVPDSDPNVPTNGFTVSADGPGADDHTFTTTLSETNGQTVNIPGLTFANSYAITVTANNGVGAPAVSNTVNATLASQVAGPSVAATNAAGHVDFAWSSYSPSLPAGVTITGYDTSYTVDGGTPVTGTQTGTTLTVPGSAGNVVVLRVTPVFSSTGVTVTAPGYGQGTGTVLANSIIQQTLTATRPVGALVLTQVCGRSGALPAEAAGTGVGQAGLGFPSGLGVTTAVGGGDDTVGGTAPNQTATGQALGNPDGSSFTTNGSGNAAQYVPNLGAADTVFGSYPYPDDANGDATPTYPTVCGVNLPAARFVDQGSDALGRGQFYATSAQINQVTVVDTRDTDPGWTASASVTDFKAPGGKSFSGNQLGWTPNVTRTTPGFTDALGNLYTQTVVAGPQVQQNQLVSSSNGLAAASADTLASAPVTKGLGIAVLDARLKLAIPVTAASGNYTAVLTFTAV